MKSPEEVRAEIERLEGKLTKYRDRSSSLWTTAHEARIAALGWVIADEQDKPKETTMGEFQKYRRSQIAELKPWEPGDDMTGVSIAAVDKEAGSPRDGDMIARNPKNHADMWLVAAKYFADNFEPTE